MVGFCLGYFFELYILEMSGVVFCRVGGNVGVVIVDRWLFWRGWDNVRVLVVGKCF